MKTIGTLIGVILISYMIGKITLTLIGWILGVILVLAVLGYYLASSSPPNDN